MQHHLAFFRHIVRHQDRNADAEIDVEAFWNVAGGSRGDLFPPPGLAGRQSLQVCFHASLLHANFLRASLLTSVALRDRRLAIGHVHHAIDEDAGRADPLRIEPAKIDDVLRLRDRQLCRRRHDRIEIPR